MLKSPLYTYENGSIKVYGNNHEVDIVNYYELSERQQRQLVKEYDQEYAENFTGFIYKDNFYPLDDFMRVESYAPAWMKKYDGYLNDSAFSGILVKLNEECNKVKVYTFIA